MPTFLSGGKTVSIDHYVPSKGGTHPAILLIHGSGGPLHGIDPYGQQAANFGINVFVAHYFERTGHDWVAPGMIHDNFLTWMETLADALNYIAAQPRVDAERIGLIGFSLGGYLALALAAHDRRIVAVAELFGGFPEELTHMAASLPPVLILHGEDDPIVPVQEAYRLERLLKEQNIPHEIKIYAGQEHSLRGLAQVDALRRIVSFFKRALGKQLSRQPRRA